MVVADPDLATPENNAGLFTYRFRLFSVLIPGEPLQWEIYFFLREGTCAEFVSRRGNRSDIPRMLFQYWQKMASRC